MLRAPQLLGQIGKALQALAPSAGWYLAHSRNISARDMSVAVSAVDGQRRRRVPPGRCRGTRTRGDRGAPVAPTRGCRSTPDSIDHSGVRTRERGSTTWNDG